MNNRAKCWFISSHVCMHPDCDNIKPHMCAHFMWTCEKCYIVQHTQIGHAWSLRAIYMQIIMNILFGSVSLCVCVCVCLCLCETSSSIKVPSIICNHCFGVEQSQIALYGFFVNCWRVPQCMKTVLTIGNHCRCGNIQNNHFYLIFTSCPVT